MININYVPNLKEYSTVAVKYIEKHILIKSIFFFMNVCCIFFFIGYVFKVVSHTVVPLNTFTLLFILSWVFFRRKVNIYFVRKSLTKNTNNIDLSTTINIDSKRISWQYKTKDFKHLLWSKIKTIYNIENKGYVVPKVLNGPVNSTFIWIPKDGFSENEEESFLEIIKKHNISIKK